MKVTNISGAGRELVAVGQVVEPGDSIEVDDELGRALCDQVDVWKSDGHTPKAHKADVIDGTEDPALVPDPEDVKASAPAKRRGKATQSADAEKE